MAPNPLQSAELAFAQFRSNVGGMVSNFQESAIVARRAPSVVVMPRHAACSPSSMLHASPLAAILPGDGVAEQVISSGVLSFFKLYNAVLISRLILTWFPSVPEQIVAPIATITDPYLNLFRGIIPPIGGTLDLSPILAFVVLNFFTDAAAALPCETTGPARKQLATSAVEFPSWAQPNKYQQAWANRMKSKRAARQAVEDAN
eukprot:gene13517-19382_t